MLRAMVRAPEISILLPARDAATTLDPCLRSVLRQSAHDWECLVVDDASTDPTASILERFRRSDARFRVIEGRGHGLVAALNLGLAACRGRWVARMDADDLMHRRRLEWQREALLANTSWSGCGGHVRLGPRVGLKDGYRAYEAWLNGMGDADSVRREAFVECPVAHPTLMVCREALTELAYRDRGWPEDYDLVLRMLAAGREIGVVRRRLLSWNNRGDRLSRNDPRYAIERFVACKAHFLSRGFLARTTRYLLWGYGGTGRALAAALALHGHRPCAIVERHPGRIGNTILGAPVIDPEHLPRTLEAPLLVSVAGLEARTLIRDWLRRRELVEQRDYVVAA